MTKRTKKLLVLTPQMQGTLRAAVEIMLSETREMETEVNDLTPDEWRTLKANADFGQKMRRVSEVTDAQLIEKRKEVEDDLPGLKQIALYRRIGEEFNPKLSAYTVRDRFLRIRKREQGR